MTRPPRPVMSRAEAADLLGVPVDADRATAQRAYRLLARDVHPDAAEAGDAVRFDALSRARAVFDRPAPARPATPPPAPSTRPGPLMRQPSAGVGNALLLLVLLVFLLVALVTVDVAVRTDGFEQMAPAARNSLET